MLLLGLAFAVSASAADDPTLPPPSAILSVDSYDLIDALDDDPVSTLDTPPSSNSTLLWGYEANFGNSRIHLLSPDPPML